MLLNVKDVILEEVNVKELNIIEGDSDIIVKKTKPNFKSIGPKFGKDVKKIQQIINNFTTEQISEIEKNGKLNTAGYEISSDDIEIYTEDIEGWIVESFNGITVALDTKLDEKLIEEGFVREFINRIQNYRRNNEFDVSDKIEIYFKSGNNINEIIQRNEEYIMNETLSEKIQNANGQDFAFSETEINGETCKIYLQKIH